jgi:iron complex outermembrane receptor protein
MDSGRAAIDPDLYDLARVEVLGGPQGNLYGAGSLGGTVKLVTNWTTTPATWAADLQLTTWYDARWEPPMARCSAPI